MMRSVHPNSAHHTWPVGAPPGPQPGRGTGGQEDPSAEEGPRTSASSDPPAASSKLPGNKKRDRRQIFTHRSEKQLFI